MIDVEDGFGRPAKAAQDRPEVGKDEKEVVFQRQGLRRDFDQPRNRRARYLVAETGLEPPLLVRQSPIIANGGMATFLSHNCNLSMLSLFVGEEPSTQQFTEIFGKSGWKLESVSTLTPVLDRFIFGGVPDPSWPNK
ncbi:hypothetical protein PSHT_09395, partial [Puccinia striiformis]